MSIDLYEHVKHNPKFHQLVTQRSRLTWGLSLIVILIYFSFILTIAFAPDLLGKPLFVGSSVTLGIPIGICIIVMAFILTGIYVRRANKTFDQINQQIIDEAKQ